jgi:hypothetical protein
MKMFLQHLQDEEEKLRKDSLKLLSTTSSLSVGSGAGATVISQETDSLKTIRILYFSNANNNNNNNSESTESNSPPNTNTHLKNFQRSFNILAKLNKPITILNSTTTTTNPNNHLSLSNVHLAIGDFFHQQPNHPHTTTTTTNSSTISLCSNLDALNDQTNNNNNLHSTMLFEHGGVKVGFMALYDEAFFSRHQNNTSNRVLFKYCDFVERANRLGEQLRVCCGATLVVALVNFDDPLNETRLLDEVSGLDLVLSSSSTTNTPQFKTSPNNGTHHFKFASNPLDHLYLLNFKLDILNANRIVDIGLDQYYVD